MLLYILHHFLILILKILRSEKYILIDQSNKKKRMKIYLNDNTSKKKCS